MLNLSHFGDGDQKDLRYFSMSKKSIEVHSVTQVYIPEFGKWICVDPTVYCTTFSNYVMKGMAREGFEQRAIDSCSVCVPFAITSRLYYLFDTTGLSGIEILKKHGPTHNVYDQYGNLFIALENSALLQATVSRIIELPVSDLKRYARG